MLTILHTEASLGWGGQEIRIVRESLGMIRRGYRVIIAAPEKSSILKKAREAGITAFPAEFRKKSIPCILAMKSLLEREGVQILNTHSSADSWVATMAAKICKKKPLVIRTRHLSTPVGTSVLSRLIYDTLTDAIITTGEEIRQKMISRNRFRGEKIVSIPTGTDMETFNPSTHPTLERKGFHAGMVSVLRRDKGHRYFLEAIPMILKEIPDAVFSIAGDGPQRRNIEEQIREFSLEGKVSLLGHREDVPGIMASLDVLVHPSSGHEGLAQSILQALAMERPVVATDIGAISEVVIDNISGLLIQPCSAEQIAEKVLEIYRNPELGRQMGKEGKRLVAAKHSADHMLNEIEALYRKLQKTP